jgi:hypothetical protein
MIKTIVTFKQKKYEIKHKNVTLNMKCDIYEEKNDISNIFVTNAIHSLVSAVPKCEA